MIDTELRRRARALHATMTVHESSIFFPTGGVFLTVTSGRMARIRSGELTVPTKGVASEDLWSVYSVWHETVHMSQLVTCPCVRFAAFSLASVGREACRRARESHLDVPPLGDLVDRYHSTTSMLETRSPDGFSPWEIIETQAVVQGLLWLTGGDRNGVRWLADRVYNEVRPAPQYIRLIDAMGDLVGDEAAVRLLPRLCFLALQTLDPSMIMAAYLDKLGREHSLTELASASPREFCDWAGLDASLISRSLRERDAQIESHPWMRLFSHYFDRFEALPDPDARLNVLFGPNGDEAQMFRPTLMVFADGEVKLSGPAGSGLWDEEAELWIAITSDSIDGLMLLENAP